MEFIRLTGAEAVTNAASRITDAAAEMQHAASEFNYAVERLARLGEEWLQRLEAISTIDRDTLHTENHRLREAIDEWINSGSISGKPKTETKPEEAEPRDLGPASKR